MSESALDLELTEIEGIGPKTKEKLIGGIESVLDLAVALPG